MALQTFSPREVQARVRAGDSAEVIAAENDWPLDKVLRYAEPLLAERAFIAEAAQNVEVRRSGGGATLREAAAAALGAPVDDADISWDAFRREDARWIVTAEYLDDDGRHRAHWTYDHTGHNLHPLDDDARTLMGARPVPVPDVELDIADALNLVGDIPVVREDEVEVVEARPRLVAVPDSDEVDTFEDVEDDEVEEIGRPTEVVAELSFDDLALEPDEPTPSTASAPTVAIPHPSTPEPAAPAAKAAARKPKARKGRASVPSWDEILFGATKRED